ncbi:MAG: uracil-DNA glycosylase [Proteobacteria bacterium]|nr:uracil-DNA glycosylase [Pseudomonadota bacterium]
MIEIYKELKKCKKCPLYKTRTKFVIGAGSVDADVLFIGEAPGRNEDLQGLPFVGRAGNLLSSYLNGIELSRKDVFITNIVKCRPPGNRDPMEEEINACFPYLTRQIGIIEPKIIVTLGRYSLKSLLGREVRIMQERGSIIDFNGVMLLPMLHPAAVLRNGNLDEKMKEDFKLLKEVIEQ